MSEEEIETREVTQEELSRIPTYFHRPYFSLTDNLFHAKWGPKDNVTSPDGDWPWKFEDTKELVEVEDLQETYPHLKDIENVNFQNLTGDYQGKRVRWSQNREEWIYVTSR